MIEMELMVLMAFVDNFYIYGTPPVGTLLWDTYAVPSTTTVYFLNNVITGSGLEFQRFL
jgi:hypothetical protein